MKNTIIPLLKKNKQFVGAYQKAKTLRKRVRFALSKLFSLKMSEKRLIEGFAACGVFPGDKIVVNSSLSSIGYLPGGAIAFVETLKRYITAEGLIVMPSYPHRDMYQYLENYVLFDVNETPSQNGAITETFRKSADVFRSLHPTHPLCIWGKNALAISEGHERSKSPYDLHSPYKKLLDLDVKNFCIGVDFEHMIMIRVIDDLWEGYPAAMYFENKLYKVPVKNRHGRVIQVETTCHDPGKAILRYNMKLFPYMAKDIKTAKLGGARTIVLSSRRMFEHQVRLAKKGVFPYRNTHFIKYAEQIEYLKKRHG